MHFIQRKFQPIISLIAVIWVVEVVNVFLGHSLTSFGVLPRSLFGLIGIPVTPFIHGSIWHAVMNTVPLAILGGLTIITGEKRFWSATVGIILISGILVWIFARGANHVGASGLVFGYFGLLITRAVIERTPLAIIVGFLTVIFYGGLLIGLLPLRAHVSFEGHLAGLIAGIAIVWLEKRFDKTA